MDFAVVEVSGKQYMVKPNQLIEVDHLGDVKELSIDKVLLWSEKGNIEVGKPYLEKTVKLEIVRTYKKPKIRVAVYKAKANSRRVKGSRREVSVVKIVDNAKAVKTA